MTYLRYRNHRRHSNSRRDVFEPDNRVVVPADSVTQRVLEEVLEERRVTFQEVPVHAKVYSPPRHTFCVSML